MKNVFIRLLEALSIPYTYDFADELYATHPNKDNMLGLYQMCEVYGIASKGVNVADKNCDELSIPSVLHVGGQFVILTDLTDDEITYDWNGQRTTQSRSDFTRSWDGNALMIEADTGAAEPSFTEHRKQDRKKTCSAGHYDSFDAGMWWNTVFSVTQFSSFTFVHICCNRCFRHWHLLSAFAKTSIQFQ